MQIKFETLKHFSLIATPKNPTKYLFTFELNAAPLFPWNSLKVEELQS